MSSEESDSEREMLERLAWLFASNADNFWPIGETVDACMEGVQEKYKEHDEMHFNEGRAWEEGQHSRAVMESAELFDQLYDYGFDPIQMAEDHLERVNEEHEANLSIDWDWLRFTRLPEEYTGPYITDK